MLGLFSALTSLFCYLFLYSFTRSSVCSCFFFFCVCMSLFPFFLELLVDNYYWFFFIIFFQGVISALFLSFLRDCLSFSLSPCACVVFLVLLLFGFALSRSLSLADKGVVQRWWLRWWRFPASLPRVVMVTDVTWWLLQSDRQGLLRWWFFFWFWCECNRLCGISFRLDDFFCWKLLFFILWAAFYCGTLFC